MRNFSFTIKDPGVVRRLRELADNNPYRLGAALKMEAESVVRVSKRITPVDTGNLRASHFVEQPIHRFGAIVVMLGAGGTAGRGNQGETNTKDVGYAERVHDDTTAFHELPGRAKFLQLALEERLPEMANNVGRHILALMQSGMR